MRNVQLIIVSAAAASTLFTGCAKSGNPMLGGYGQPNYTGAYKAAMPGLTNPVGLSAMAPTEIMGNIKASNNRAAFENMMQNGGPVGVIQQKMKEAGAQVGQPSTPNDSPQSSELAQNNAATQDEQKPQEDGIGSKVGGFLGNVASGVAAGAFEVMKNRLIK